jgi:DNA repair protein RadC
MNYQAIKIKLPLRVKEASGAQIKMPDDVAKYCADMREMAQESVQVLTLDTKHKIINRHLVTLGLANSSLLHAREVFRAAIADNAVAIILVHNHPSGDATPSAEDIQITRKMIDTGKIIGINVIDHIIIGDPIFSMRESGTGGF